MRTNEASTDWQNPKTGHLYKKNKKHYTIYILHKRIIRIRRIIYMGYLSSEAVSDNLQNMSKTSQLAASWSIYKFWMTIL